MERFFSNSVPSHVARDGSSWTDNGIYGSPVVLVPTNALGLRNLASFQVVAHPEGDHCQALRDFVAVTKDS